MRNDYEEKNQDMFTQKLLLDAIETEHAHQGKCNSMDSNNNRSQTIFVKMLWFNGKSNMLNIKLRGQSIFISNDFKKTTLELRKDMMVEVKRLSELDKSTYLNYTTIIFREKVKEEM